MHRVFWPCTSCKGFSAAHADEGALLRQPCRGGGSVFRVVCTLGPRFVEDAGRAEVIGVEVRHHDARDVALRLAG